MALPLRAAPARRHGAGDRRQSAAGGRLRLHLHRRDRALPGGGGPARGQRKPGAPGAGAHRRPAAGQGGCRGGQRQQDPLPRRRQPRPAAAAERRPPVRLGAGGKHPRSRADGGAAGVRMRHDRQCRRRPALHRDAAGRAARHLLAGCRQCPGATAQLRHRRAAGRAGGGVLRPGAGTRADAEGGRLRRGGAVGSAAAAPGAAEFPVQRHPLHAQGPGPAGLPAAPRPHSWRPPAHRGVGHRPRHPRNQAPRGVRGVPPAGRRRWRWRPRRQGVGPRPCHRRPHRPAARPSGDAALHRRARHRLRGGGADGAGARRAGRPPGLRPRRPVGRASGAVHRQ